MCLDTDVIVNGVVAFHLCCQKKYVLKSSLRISLAYPQCSFSNQSYQIPLFGLILLVLFYFFFCMDLHSSDSIMTINK